MQAPIQNEKKLSTTSESSFFKRKQTFVDITVVHAVAKSNVRLATGRVRVCREVEHHKVRKYNIQDLTSSNSASQFCPLVFFTTIGELGKQTAELIDELSVAGAEDDCPCGKTSQYGSQRRVQIRRTQRRILQQAGEA